jgi:hypothetical protein
MACPVGGMKFQVLNLDIKLLLAHIAYLAITPFAMRHLAVIASIFLYISTNAQPIIGEGLVKIQFDDKPVIDLYRKPTDQTFNRRIEFYRDSISKGIKIKNFEEVSHWLKPEVLWLDDFQFNFRVKTVKQDWFEVVVNNETGHTFWIRNDRSTKFRSWEDYFRDMPTISRDPYNKQKIRNRPDEKADEIKYEGQDCFQVKSLQGNWVEIFTPPTCDALALTKISSGWIKWRSGNRILIDY